MALNPEISLGVRPVVLPPLQIQTPLEQFGKILSLRELMQRGQLTGLELQLKQQELEEAKGLPEYLRSKLPGGVSGTPAVTPPTGTPQPGTPVPTVTPGMLAGTPGSLMMGTDMAGSNVHSVDGGKSWVNSDTGAAVPGRIYGTTDIGGAPPGPGATPQALTGTLLRPMWGAPLTTPTTSVTTAPAVTAPVTAPTPSAPLTTTTPQPPGLLSVPIGGGVSTPRWNYGEIVTKFPMKGPALVKGLIENDKNQQEATSKQLANARDQASRLGVIAKSILEAKNPAAAYVPGIMQAVDEGLLTSDIGRQLKERGYNGEQLKQFVRQADDLKTQAATALDNAKTRTEDYQQASSGIGGVNDQAGYDKFFPTLPPDLQREFGPTFSSALKDVILYRGIPGKEQAQAASEQQARDAVLLSAAARQDQANAAAGRPSDSLQRAKDLIGANRAQPFQGLTTPDEIMGMGQKAHEYITATETVRHNRRVEELTSQGQTQTRANQIATTESKLRDDFTQVTKEFRGVRDAYGRIQSALQAPRSGASDIALMYGYMKILDPNSAVREGEFANAQNAGGVVDNIRNLYNRLLNGERLPEHIRQDMLTNAQQLYERAGTDHQKIVEQYTDIARRSSADPRNVVVDFQTTAPRKAGEPEKPKYQTIEKTSETPGGRVSGTITIAPPGKIRVTSPEGQDFWMDAEKWPTAEKRGFTRK